MSDKGFLTPSLIKAAYKSKQLFLFSGPKGQVMASPSITSIINEYDLSLWDKLHEEDLEARESALNTLFELLQNKNFKSTISKVGDKLYLTSFKNS